MAKTWTSIGVLPETRDRFHEMRRPKDKNADEFLNHVLDYYDFNPEVTNGE